MRKYKPIISLLVALMVWGTTIGFTSYPGVGLQDPVQDPAQPAAPNDTYPFHSYLPLVSNIMGSRVDLIMGGLEPTQAIQTDSHSVALITNRPTVLRVYASTNTGAAVSNVRVSVTATRNGANLAGSPLTTAAGSVQAAWSRGNINSSYNIRLPAAWLSGQVNLVVRLDASNTYNESNENNNLATVTLNFQTTPNMDIKVVPIIYTAPGGVSYPQADTAYLAPAMMKMYPVAQVAVSSRTAIGVTCDLKTDGCWDGLLDYVTALKKTDNAPQTQFYYGMIPLVNSGGTSWFSSGIAGLGWVGQGSSYQNARASIGLTNWPNRLDGGLIAAHEIGHNLGRHHAPCGVSGDASYPYGNASIGNYGLDVDLLSVLLPTQYKDVMSYCDPQWISDYTYNALRTALQTNIGAGPYPSGAAAGSGLLVRAALVEGQDAKLSPAYAVTGAIDPPAVASEYAVEFLDENGEVVSSYPVDVLTASEPGIDVRRINALVPAPDASYAAYRVSRSGEALARQDLPNAQALALRTDPATLSASADTLLIEWGNPQTPALVRYTVDGGQTWTTLTLDQLGGALSVARESLPTGKIQFQIVSADALGQTWMLDWEN